MKKPFVAVADVAESHGGSSSPRLPPGFGHGHGGGNVNGRGSDVSRDDRPLSNRRNDGRKMEGRESKMAVWSTLSTEEL